MARFYADENFDYLVVERLRALGHDVLTVQETGEQGHDDTRVLERATRDGRSVLTFDRMDFKRLHRQNPSHAGIISCTRDNDRDGLAARIHLAALAAGSLTGQHVRVNRPGLTP
jgi:predicted nuclease of predicted toxin-antitoxin system